MLGTQVTGWDRGRPARKTRRQARSGLGFTFFALRAHCGETPAVPANRLTGVS
jgi:hypothetical protein